MDSDYDSRIDGDGSEPELCSHNEIYDCRCCQEEMLEKASSVEYKPVAVSPQEAMPINEEELSA